MDDCPGTKIEWDDDNAEPVPISTLICVWSWMKARQIGDVPHLSVLMQEWRSHPPMRQRASEGW